MCMEKLLPFVVIALVFSSLAHAGPFSSWAPRGVVVNKTFRPTPFSHSLGMDGTYRLELRGQEKNVRRQMVTREIFLAYEIGGEFDQHATPAAFKLARLAATAKATLAPKRKSLADALEARIESDYRTANSNLPRGMLPETEGF